MSDGATFYSLSATNGDGPEAARARAIIPQGCEVYGPLPRDGDVVAFRTLMSGALFLVTGICHLVEKSKGTVWQSRVIVYVEHAGGAEAVKKAGF